MQKLSNLPPALNARLFKTNGGLWVLKFSILIAQSLLNGKSVSSNLACMPVVNKVGQKVKKFILRFFRETITINKSGKKSLF